MFLTERIEKAIVRATVLHHFQKRKVSGVPFIVHPYSVAFLLTHYTDDEDVIIAGLLHDVLEDTPDYTEAMFLEEFGKRPLAIVKEVTEDYSEAEKLDHILRGDTSTWHKRKEKYLHNLENDSQEALLVAAADKICNMRNIIDEYRSHGEGIWVSFGRKPEELVWFYESANRVISAYLRHPLSVEMDKIYQELEATVRSSDLKNVASN